MWFPVADSQMLFDSESYEAFPAAFTTPAGTTIATWAHGTNHYTTGSGRMVRMPAGSTVWSEPADVEVGAVQFASFGTRIAMLTMATKPYRGWVQISTDDGVTWGPKLPVGFSVTSGGVFPSGLAWVDDGTPDGKMFAVGYWGGVHISTSADAGVTWTVRPKLTNDGTYTEASVIQAADGRLVALARREPANQVARLEQWTSHDLGDTWTLDGSVIPGGMSTPLMTLMPDGAILVPFRDATRNQSHSYAMTVDHGATWLTYGLNDERNMYAQFATRGADRAVLVGSSMSRTSHTEAWIWSQTFGVKTAVLVSGYIPPDRPEIEVTLGAIPDGTATVRLERVVDGMVTVVRGAKAFSVAGSTAWHLDAEAPVGRDVTYRVTAYSSTGAVLGSGESSPVHTPDPGLDYAWLSDPLEEGSALLVPLVKGTSTEFAYVTSVEARLPSGSKQQRLTIGSTVEIPTWVLHILADGQQAMDDLRRFFQSASSLLVRVPSRVPLPGLLYGAASSAVERPYVTNGASVWEVELVTSAGPGLDVIQPRWTWDDWNEWSIATDTTWDEQRLVFPTWDAAKRGL